MLESIRYLKTKRIVYSSVLIGVVLTLGCSNQNDSKVITVADAGMSGAGVGGSSQVIPDSSGNVPAQTAGTSGLAGSSGQVAQVDASANVQPPVGGAIGSDAGINLADANTGTAGEAGGSAGTGFTGATDSGADTGTTGDASVDAGDAGSPLTSNCPITPPRAGNTDGTIDVDGTTRTYVLYIPSSYTGETPAPLVFDWHGLMLNGPLEQALSTYVAKADEEGFIMVFPNGIDSAWNVGPCCTVSREVDDAAFARAMVKKLTSELCIDVKRIYSVGYSMGGGISHYLACNAADIFAAVAPAAFDLLIEEEEPCHPSRPISQISFRGTADFIVPYDGGDSRPPNGLDVTIHFLGAEATFEKWAELNGCSGSPVADVVGPGCRTYTECKDGVEVTLCTSEGGSHDPGDANISWPVLKKYTLP